MDYNTEKLRSLLDEQEYPSVYLYKFIVRNDQNKILEIKKCFSEISEFSETVSRNGNYVSLNVREMMLNTDDILHRYQQVYKIDDVIVL